MELKDDEFEVYYGGKSNPKLEIAMEATLKKFGYKCDDISCRRMVREGIITQTWGLTFKKPN